MDTVNRLSTHEGRLSTLQWRVSTFLLRRDFPQPFIGKTVNLPSLLDSQPFIGNTVNLPSFLDSHPSLERLSTFLHWREPKAFTEDCQPPFFGEAQPFPGKTVNLPSFYGLSILRSKDRQPPFILWTFNPSFERLSTSLHFMDFQSFVRKTVNLPSFYMDFQSFVRKTVNLPSFYGLSILRSKDCQPPFILWTFNPSFERLSTSLDEERPSTLLNRLATLDCKDLSTSLH